MTVKRWELLRTMSGAGPLAIREVARCVDRDVKGVHGDVHGLLKAGILQETGDGLIISSIRCRSRRYHVACCLNPEVRRRSLGTAVPANDSAVVDGPAIANAAA
jgi:hypothetical protein